MGGGRLWAGWRQGDGYTARLAPAAAAAYTAAMQESAWLADPVGMGDAPVTVPAADERAMADS